MIKKMLTLYVLALIALMAMSASAQAQTLADPCSSGVKQNVAISETNSAMVIPGDQRTKTYLCFIFLGTSGAENLSIVEGTGAVCATNQLIIMGGPGQTGPARQANDTITLGSGTASIGFSTVAGNDICLLQSASGLVAGNMIYVRQ
jgi:hypothetical protein